jgi:hypothetical protein
MNWKEKMIMEIVSGRIGKPHVTSQQFRQLIEGTVGQESCILTSGENLEPELASNNSLKIRSGMLAHHGNISSVKIGTYDAVNLSNGSQGMKRIDLVVCRYTRNAETEVESCNWVVIMGTPVSSNPVAPTYTVGNLQEGDLVDDCPVFEVHYDGINVTEVRKILSVAPNLTELNSNIKILNSKKDSGHALKVFNASENLVYGCWDDGLYRYPGYYSGNGAPSDWAGIMLVSPIFINGEINGFLKVAWDMSMTQYIMKNNKDGSVSQAWTKM